MSIEEIKKLVKKTIKGNIMVVVPTGINMCTLEGKFVEVPFGKVCTNARILKSGTLVADVDGQTLMSLSTQFFAREDGKLAKQVSIIDGQIDKLLHRRNLKLAAFKKL